MKIFTILIILIFITVVILTGGLTNYKSEILYCSKNSNECYVEKINLFNIKSKKKIVDYTDIKNVSYIKQKIKGNLYARGYTDYQLIFVTKDNARKIIFSEVYFDYPQVFAAIKEIKHNMKSKSEYFVIKKK